MKIPARQHRLAKKNSEAGIILFTVLIMIIVFSLVAIEFMSATIGQQKTSQTTTDEIKAAGIARGTASRLHIILTRELTLPATNITVNLGEKQFIINPPGLELYKYQSYDDEFLYYHFFQVHF